MSDDDKEYGVADELRFLALGFGISGASCLVLLVLLVALCGGLR